MSTESDEKQLKPCLTRIIELVEQCIHQFKVIKDPSQASAKDDRLLRDSQLNTNVYTFTFSDEENTLLETLTSQIEQTLQQHLSRLSIMCLNYLLDVLHPYHYDRLLRKFTPPLTIDLLHSLKQDLKGLLGAVEAFPAAYNGDLQTVTKFIKEHPTYKDKPGLWETTLLYSAARNNHLNIVKYLIETAHCSVNAQNQRDVGFALDATATDYIPRPTAASTALHAACFNNHLNIVKYLVEHGADYFIQNQAHETPLMNGAHHPEIKKYFQEYLIMSYTDTLPDDLPNVPVLDDDRRPRQDCMWQYKPFQDPKWYKFTAAEAQLLQKALLSSEKFQQQVYLKVAKGLYSVSMMEFVRSGRHEQDPQKNMAWVRCCASSVMNFDCYALWQIMLIQHPKVSKETESTPSLKIQHFPTSFDSQFKLQLNTWYSSNAETSKLIDDSINYRRKVISISIEYVSDDLKLNLRTFEFSNNEKSIVGYLRWIPKLVSYSTDDNQTCIPVDNYQPMATMQPVPLTTRRSKKYSPAKKTDQQEADDDTTKEDDDDETDFHASMASGMGNEHESDDDDDTPGKDQNADENTGTWSVTDLNDQLSATDSSRVHVNGVAREDSEVSVSDYFHERIGEEKKATLVERDNSSLKNEMNAAVAAQLAAEVQQLKDQIEKEKNQQLQQSKQLLDELQRQLQNKLNQEKQSKELTQQIKAVDYDRVESITVKVFLFSKLKQIINHLKTKHSLENHSLGIPSITIAEKQDYCCISVTGLPVHHEEFKLILRRIQTLSNLTQSAKIYYHKQLNSKLRTISMIITQQVPSSHDWRYYTKYFHKLAQTKIDEFIRLFDEYITQESKALADQCITDASFQASIQLRKLTDRYIQKKQFEPELELLKYEALDEYIKEHVLSERLKFEKKPSTKSLQTMNGLIEKVKRELKVNPIYSGCQLAQWKEIPKLLQQVMLYYRCFLLQLPLYESSKELLEKIEKNTVITIATSTGSGKSSLLPALLIAEGYEKVVVTQPRRLPCKSICQRVNDTMTARQDRFKLAGWAVSGDEGNVKAPVLYLTDGLLKERLLHDENLLPPQNKVKKGMVFFIDEVHERSVNIDLCLALIARLLINKPQLRSQVKIIISSATLDSSVPKLFRQIAQLKFDEFQMPMLGTLYPVSIFERPNQNLLDLVQDLCKKRQRHDQILCFVSSVAEVNQCCRLLEEVSRGTIVAFPLVQSQSAKDQQNNIEHGSIFFSTTVAETSLTFPSLKYVIDTGMINIPVYNHEKKQTVLEEIRAAQSTIKQRLGRLGRTQPGEYYSLYDFKVEEKKYPTPQIRQSELVNVEFSLRKSTIQNGLSYISQFLPDPPTAEQIKVAVDELKRLGVLDTQEKLTSIGSAISRLPDFGSLAMSKSVLAALNENNCGQDLIVLSSILSVLNTSSILKSIPLGMKRPEGDFMTLINVMNEILLVRQSVRKEQFDIGKVCHAKGLTAILHVLKQALRRYESLEKAFNLSDEYRAKAQVSSNNWYLIAKSLLNGYGENVFVSMKELQGRTHLFTRYSPPREDQAVLDLQSTVTRAVTSAPVSLVLARDIRFSSSIRATAVLSFIGEIKSQWIEYRLQRKITLNAAEQTKLNTDNILVNAKQTFPNVNIQLNPNMLSLEGSAGLVLDAELDILRQLIVELKFTLKNEYATSAVTDYQRMKRNLESVSKMTWIFNPMIWRWEAQRQVKITVNNNPVQNECEITIDGRDSQNQLVHNEFRSFLGWLKYCAVIRHPQSGVSPRILKPQMRKNCLDMEQKISHITDDKRSTIDLWKGLKGSKSTRETRMEVVAWIAVCKFDCRLEGGFVRDWIVGNYTARPTGDPSTWITYITTKAGLTIPNMSKDLIPSDLDCHLPSHKYFDIDKFLDQLHKYQIECEVLREDWRYVLLFDKKTKTGAFTMDLIEPHVALTHDRIDFDVSNLSLERGYTKELGMRVDITHKPYSIELENIVDNIKNKRFQILRPVDSIVQDRIKKMTNRGWTQFGEPMHVIPDPPPKYSVVVVALPQSTALYDLLVQQMKTYINAQVRVLSIEQIKNPLLEDAYLAMKQLIAKQCKGQNPNERELFHGTHGEAIEGIMNDGFDDRYWGTNFGKGKFGHGAYFADNPGVSHNYTEPNPVDQTRIMYFNKVVLGKESILQTQNGELMSAPKGFHSTHGQFPGHPNSDEYIVYRYGQALPYLKITYKA